MAFQARRYWFVPKINITDHLPHPPLQSVDSNIPVESGAVAMSEHQISATGLDRYVRYGIGWHSGYNGTEGLRSLTTRDV